MKKATGILVILVFFAFAQYGFGKEAPSRVVSLVPVITQIIFAIGAELSLKGIPYQSVYPPGTERISNVGGFFSPSVKAIKALKPDVIFLSPIHESVKERFKNGECRLNIIDIQNIQDLYDHIDLLGTVFRKPEEAKKLKDRIRSRLEMIEKKVTKIPDAKRKRVIRIIGQDSSMGQDGIMIPGDDSFQNELITAAGGIPPQLGRKGNTISITKEEWVTFNPQVIYGCGSDRKLATELYDLPGWKDVDAVKERKIFYFPCTLASTASTGTGLFVSWLSATIYGEAFSKKTDQILPEEIFQSRELHLALDYVKNARISTSWIHDFENKTLIIDFNEPLTVVSTLEGERTGMEAVGNHFSPPPCWGLSHKSGLKGERDRVYGVIGKSHKTSAFLFTGADMDHLAIVKERFKEMEVYALVTAGVTSNAVRMSQDMAGFYEPGTINILILPNMRLSARAMTRAIISATEAKTAALQDLDVRSSYTPLLNQATGTGTDNILVVQGTGTPIDNAGGHSKMGELIAKAVYSGVKEAVYKQNGITEKRNVFRRLMERGISISELVFSDQAYKEKNANLSASLEELLLQPVYASFLETTFAASDDYEKGLITDLNAHEVTCGSMADKIAGAKIDEMKDLLTIVDLPPVLQMTLNAMVNGIYFRPGPSD